MSYKFTYRSAALVLYVCATAQPCCADEAADLVKAAINYWRDVSSYSVVDMTIHKPKWQRTMTLRVQTRGEKESLVRVIVPAKDAGNGTLLVDNFLLTITSLPCDLISSLRHQDLQQKGRTIAGPALDSRDWKS